MESSMGEEPGKCVTNEAERTRAQEMVVKTATTKTHNIQVSAFFIIILSGLSLFLFLCVKSLK